jgi:hypothetical protein
VPALERALGAGRPYLEAGYFLALAHLAEGETAEAAARLADLVGARPDHWHGRLLLAHLEGRRGSTARAASLVREDPADPRAAWVLWKAAEAAGEGDRAASVRKAFEALSREPGADRRIAEFTALTQGRYVPPRRIRIETAPPRRADRESRSRRTGTDG